MKNRLPLAAWATLNLVLAWPAAAAPDFVSVKPTPRVEYWQKREQAIDQQLRDTQALASVKLVFVGDSITDFWLLDEDPWVPGRHFGQKVWDESFGAHALPANRALNIGISGDRIEHLLHRVLPKAQGGRGQLEAPTLKPDFIVLMIGINNSWAAESPVVDSIVEGVRAMLRSVHKRQPQARIVLQSLLPTSEPARQKDVVLPVNQALVQMAASAEFAPHTVYLDLFPGFIDAKGNQVGSLFTDGLHPNEAGYRVWRDRLLPFLDRQRAVKTP
jgi:lysophospholipase L1-like esterase